VCKEPVKKNQEEGGVHPRIVLPVAARHCSSVANGQFQDVKKGRVEQYVRRRYVLLNSYRVSDVIRTNRARDTPTT